MGFKDSKVRSQDRNSVETTTEAEPQGGAGSRRRTLLERRESNEAASSRGRANQYRGGITPVVRPAGERAHSRFLEPSRPPRSGQIARDQRHEAAEERPAR
ncbi:hypothetical protein MRX96_001366 [Rhipicephalus microplus]